MNRTVSTYEAKAHLSKLIAEVEQTRKPVTICRNRKPVVDLVAHVERANPLKQAPALKGAVFHGDPCAPVHPDDWPEALR